LRYLLPVFILAFIFFITNHALANNSGVLGPNVDPDDRSIQFRTALELADNDSQSDLWAYRIHYQHSFNDTFRGRVLMQYRDINGFEYDFARAELLYNFKKRGFGETWSSALRFDLRTRRGSRSEEFAINWANQWDFANSYRARAIIIVNKLLSNTNSRNDIVVQTRGSFSKKLENGLRVGLQMLNVHGEVGDLPSLSEQALFIGPAISGSLGRFQYEFRYLNGITDVVRNNNFSLRVTTQI
jgi:hypothetical protein